VRDSRSSIIASIKTRLFEVFYPNIQKLDTTRDSQMIYNWKRSQQTRTCLKKLRETYQNTDHTYQDEIIMRVWPTGFTLNDKIFAISVCHFILSKDYDGMSCKSQYIMKIMKQLEVSVIVFIMARRYRQIGIF
jgi:hypothetical protein